MFCLTNRDEYFQLSTPSVFPVYSAAAYIGLRANTAPATAYCSCRFLPPTFPTSRSILPLHTSVFVQILLLPLPTAPAASLPPTFPTLHTFVFVKTLFTAPAAACFLL